MALALTTIVGSTIAIVAFLFEIRRGNRWPRNVSLILATVFALLAVLRGVAFFSAPSDAQGLERTLDAVAIALLTSAAVLAVCASLIKRR